MLVDANGDVHEEIPAAERLRNLVTFRAKLNLAMVGLQALADHLHQLGESDPEYLADALRVLSARAAIVEVGRSWLKREKG